MTPRRYRQSAPKSRAKPFLANGPPSLYDGTHGTDPSRRRCEAQAHPHRRRGAPAALVPRREGRDPLRRLPVVRLAGVRERLLDRTLDQGGAGRRSVFRDGPVAGGARHPGDPPVADARVPDQGPAVGPFGPADSAGAAPGRRRVRRGRRPGLRHGGGGGVVRGAPVPAPGPVRVDRSGPGPRRAGLRVRPAGPRAPQGVRHGDGRVRDDRRGGSVLHHRGHRLAVRADDPRRDDASGSAGGPGPRGRRLRILARSLRPAALVARDRLRGGVRGRSREAAGARVHGVRERGGGAGGGGGSG